MGYTFREVKYELISLAQALPTFNVTYKSRSKTFEIKYKPNKRYLSGQECFDTLRVLYETTYLRKIQWDFLKYTINAKSVDFTMI